MKIVLKLDNDVTYVNGYLSPETYEDFKKELGYLPQDAIWKIKKQEKDIREAELSGKPVPDWKKNWDGRISTVCYNYNHCRCGLKKEGMHFPTGLTSLAVSFLKERNYSVQVLDIRKKVEKTLNLSMSSSFEERDYQTEVVNKTDNTTRGIIKVATGGGKSSIAASIISRRGVSPTIFYVPSIDLLTQSKNELEKFIVDSNGENIKVGQIGGGKMDIQDINVMTIQTAVQSLGGVWVKYDDECQNDEDMGWERDVKGKYQKDITELIKNAKLIIADECVDGNSIIYTEKGKVKISDIEKLECEYVLSYNGERKVFKKIKAFMPKGNKKVLKIKFISGKQIRCTSDHPLMTKNGWVEAGKLSKNSEVFTCGKDEQKKNGVKNIKNLLKTPLFVYADAEKELIQNMHPYHCLLNMGGQENIENIFMDMIRDQNFMTQNYQIWNNKQYLEHCLETLVYLLVRREVLIQGLYPIIVLNKNYGLNIRLIFYPFCPQKLQNQKMEDMEKILFLSERHVLSLLIKYILFAMLMAKKELVKNGLIKLGISDWHGGYVMTEVEEKIILDFIPRDILRKRLKLFLSGCIKNLEKLVLINQKENIILSIYERMLYKKCFHLLGDTFQNVCNINYENVVSIEEDGFADVYDIEVEDTHCFFANDILVHNCQHWSSQTCQIISENSINALYRWALSATPKRDQEDDILIDACFGKTVANINASYLIKHKFLVPPVIRFFTIDNKFSTKKINYANIYKEAIVENIYRNKVIATAAENFLKEGRNILILCKQISHGKILEKMIEGSVFLHGEHSGKKRKEHLDKMRLGEPRVTISSVIFDEGIDVRALDTLILAGSGKSSTRALQRVGRILRPFTYPDGRVKKQALVLDFMDNCRYLQEHSKKRFRMYKTEPEFDVSIYKS